MSLRRNTNHEGNGTTVINPDYNMTKQLQLKHIYIISVTKYIQHVYQSERRRLFASFVTTGISWTGLVALHVVVKGSTAGEMSPVTYDGGVARYLHCDAHRWLTLRGVVTNLDVMVNH